MKFKKALKQTIDAIKMSLPTLVGVLLLTSFVVVVIPKNFYTRVFMDNYFIDAFLGGIIGSIAAGNPMTSYVLAGELLERNVSMIAIVAFLVTWVTVGLIQLPAEIVMLGKRFAIVRNVVSFVSAIIIAFLTVITLIFV
jgi:uncharacterized membrane protein YraQ (UPF0718 family)